MRASQPVLDRRRPRYRTADPRARVPYRSGPATKATPCEATGSTYALLRRLAGKATACAIALSLFDAATASAEGARIRVRGTAKIVAHASRDQGELVLSGSLLDDAGKPLAAEPVTILVTRESDPADPKVLEGIRDAHPCDKLPARASTQALRVDAPVVVTTTDEGGRFCFRARLTPDRHLAHLSWHGSSLVDAADADLAFDLSRQALVLRFDPTPRLVSLDAPALTVEAAALVEDDGTTQAKAGLLLTVVDERSEELGRAVTDTSGRVRVTIDTTKLGPPGPGALRVAFGGDAQTAFGAHAAEIERRVKVRLRVPAAERGELKPAVPEDGIPLVVDVSSSAGPVTEGAIEARIGDVIVGAAPVERGIARLALTFAAPGNEVPLRLRYVPSAPWFEPQSDTTLRLPIRGPGLLSKVPLLVTGLAVLVFFLIGRVASKRNKPAALPARASEKKPAPSARVDVVRPAIAGERGFRGIVLDAHDGTPVPHAQIWVFRASFSGRALLATVTAGEDGRFRIDSIDAMVGDEQLSVEGPLHARLVQPLPAFGELSVMLVLRRRAVLARLVTWARRRGRPFDAKPEPTPGHVRRVAEGDARTARWADAVERAAFGREALDAHAESEIERLAPTEGAAAPAPIAPEDERR